MHDALWLAYIATFIKQGFNIGYRALCGRLFGSIKAMAN